MQLRDYQITAIENIKQSIAKGHKAPILRLDCGAGKTAVALTLAHLFLTTAELGRQGAEVLFLVHRTELRDQTKEAIEKMGLSDENIRVGMVLSVANRLDNYNPDMIICDECNFALATNYRRILCTYPKALRIGLSATPIRLSGEPMGLVFDDLIEVCTANDLIAKHYLAPYDYYAPDLGISTDGIAEVAGDYDTRALERLLNDPKVYGDVIRHFVHYASDKRTICYCTTVKHSQEMAKRFTTAGYSAAHIDGTMGKRERAETVKKFRNGEVQILCNCDVVSFGFDCPDCDCVMLLRPTKSLALYIQQAMRSLRPREGKKAVIIDCVANVQRFGMPTDCREYSLNAPEKSKKQKQAETKQAENKAKRKAIEETNNSILVRIEQMKATIQRTEDNIRRLEKETERLRQQTARIYGTTQRKPRKRKSGIMQLLRRIIR